ncbi:MAG TPA: 4-(cytidine 5'-diphospho)-2-C-methyl-D-erythritol kinase [Rhizomicrobium sp.]|nr:4-(cytidine 5'-diphospho)-2-C-methyl-D-erythritol kinase [Rhizomicrobium sp.]
MKIQAPAKVNLFLHIGSRRDDGYHNLESLAVFARVSDELSFASADELSLEIDGPFASDLHAEKNNLVLRAARALGEYAAMKSKREKTGAHIRLTKNLPVASGIGGGSADAAATLRGLTLLWDLHIDKEMLGSIALLLGADVPVCLLSKPSWMEGVGERVTPIFGIPELPMVLVNPRIAVSTAHIFGALKERTGTGQVPKPKNIRDAKTLANYLRATANDLEAPAMEEAPIINDVITALSSSGALLSRMSGSGATCFGLFENQDDANKAAVTISNAHPNWWITAA